MIKSIWIKEIKGEIYTWKSTLWLLIASLLFSFTSYLLLTDKELSLLDQTELLWLLGKIIVGVGLLIITIDASSVLTIEFEKGTAEGLFSAPINIWEIIWGKILFVLTLWLIIYAVSIPYIIVASEGSKLVLPFCGYILLLGTLVAFGFSMLIMAISLAFRSGKNALTMSLFLLLAFSIPALFSSTLKLNSVAGFFSRVNPIDNVFSCLDNVLVDYQTGLSQNMKFLLPLLIFCIFTFAILWISTKRFHKKGVVKDE